MHCPVLHAEVAQQLAETINLDEGRKREGGIEGGREGGRREIVTASKVKMALPFIWPRFSVYIENTNQCILVVMVIHLVPRRSVQCTVLLRVWERDYNHV